MSEANIYPGYSLRRDYLLWTLVLGLITLTAIMPRKLPTYLQLVDWPTIATLLGLLILTKGMELSGWLSQLSARIVAHVHNQRQLALLLIALSALLAMALTNDVALFIVVPLTLSLGQLTRLPLRRLVIFEALAVNGGSLLTPIGNPQNIFLWQQSGVSWLVFAGQMLPLFAICMLVLGAFSWAAFKAIPIDMHDVPRSRTVENPRLLLVSAALYLPFLVIADLRYTTFAVALVTVVFLFAAPRILCRIDWPLIIVFVLMFIELRLLGQQLWITRAIAALNLQQPMHLFGAGLLLSQGISNVPASILLAGYATDWRVIAWAVDVGGFGLVIGSLANLIALRIGRQQGSLLAFHAWSVPFLLLSAALAWFWLWL